MSGRIARRTRKKFSYSGGFRKRRANEIKRLIQNVAETNLTNEIVENIACDDPVPPLSNNNNCEINVSNEYMDNVNNDMDITDCESENSEIPLCADREFNFEVFVHELVQWTLKNKVNHEQLRGLMKIWNDFVPLKSLPCDPRTLLRTPRDVGKFDGNYWHNGLKKCLSNALKSIPNLPGSISLRFNLDGIPLSKSSSVDCWPILVDIYELPNVSPCVIGIYCGKSEHTKFT